MDLYQGKTKIKVSKCKKPTFNNHRGRTWDTGRIFIDKIEIKVHLDTSWGQYIYWQYENQWYKLPMYSKGGEPHFNIDPFDNTGKENSLSIIPERDPHPEQQEGEIFIINAKDGENWSKYPDWIESLRLGEVAYSTDGKIVPGHKPLFGKLKPVK